MMKSARESDKRGFYRAVYPIARSIGITRKEMHGLYMLCSELASRRGHAVDTEIASRLINEMMTKL